MFKKKSRQILKHGFVVSILLISVFLFWQACSDSPSSSAVGDDEDDVVTTINCSGLELGAETGEPVSFLSVEGVVQGLGNEPLVWIDDVDDEEARVAAFLERTDGDNATLTVPFHPVNWREGGEVTVTILSEDGGSGCDPLPLYIEGLEPSTKSINTTIERLELSVYQLAEAYGLDAEELKQADVNGIDLRFAGLASFIQAVDGDNNPNSIRAILAGESEVFQNGSNAFEDSEFKELVNAVFENSGLFELIDEVVESLDEHSQFLEKSEYAFKYKENKLDKVISGNQVHQSLTPAELSILLEDQMFYQDLEGSFIGTGVEGASLIFGSVSAIAGVFGLAPASAYAGLAGNLFSTVDVMISLFKSILPSELQGIELEAGPLEYNEDQDDIGSWSATLEAHSVSWTLTWPDAIGLVPMVGPPAKAIERFGKMIPGIDDLTLNVLQAAQSYFVAVWGITEESGPITIPELVYEIRDGIDPSRDGEDEYIFWELARIEGELDDDAFSLKDDETRYYPVAVGVSELRVGTVPGTFADQPRVATKQLEVKPITVEILPRPIDGVALYSGPPFYVQKGDEGLPLMVRVSNTENPDIEWQVTGDGNLLVFGDQKTDADYIIPESLTTDLVIVSAESTGGARNHPQAPRRSDTARIYVVESPLLVTPNPRCVQVDQSIEFNAIFEGEEISFDELSWDLEGPGSLSNDGVYNATNTGSVAIRFWLSGDQSMNYDIEFEVETLCSYLRATGTGQFEQSRDVAFEYSTPSLFDHESTCISLVPYEPDDWFTEMVFGNNAWIMSVSEGDDFIHDLYLHKSFIERDGEWEEVIETFGNNLDINNSLYTMFFNNGDHRSNYQQGIRTSTSFPLHLTREIAMVDGEEVPVYSGNYYNERLDDGAGPYLKVKFKGIVPGENGCF